MILREAVFFGSTMTPSPPLTPHFLAMVKSPGPFLLSVVVTFCSVECVLLHTNATDGDATPSMQHVPDHQTSVVTTNSSGSQKDQERTPHDVLSFTSTDSKIFRYLDHASLTNPPRISYSDTSSDVDDETRKQEMPIEDIFPPETNSMTRNRLDLLTINKNTEVNSGSDKSSWQSGEVTNEPAEYKPEIVRNVSRKSAVSDEGVRDVPHSNAVTNDPLDLNPHNGQRVGGTLHLDHDIIRTNDEIPSAKTLDDKRMNDHQTSLRVEQKTPEDKEALLGNANTVPYVHDIPRVYIPVHKNVLPHRDDTLQGNDVTHANSPTYVDVLQVGDPPHVDGGMNVDEVSRVEDLPLNTSNDHYIPDGDTPRRVESDFGHYYDYSAYQTYSARDYDFFDIQPSDFYAEYGHYYGYSLGEGHDPEYVVPCYPERCLWTVFQVLSDDNNSTGHWDLNDLTEADGSSEVKDDLGNQFSAEVIQKATNQSQESVGDLDLASSERGYSRGHAWYAVVCNASVSLRNLSTVAQESCNRQTVRLQLTQQLELCRVTRLDFQSFQDLTYLSITHSALTEVEDGAFGNLLKLETLDLSHNQLHVLSWSTIWPASLLLPPSPYHHTLSWHTAWPASLPGERLRHINTTGNPLVLDDCRNAWLLTWGRRKTLHSQTWREITTRAGVEARSRSEAEGVTSTETKEAETFSHKSTNSTTDDCPPTGTTPSSCYLCPAILRELSTHKGEDVCEEIVVECSVRGQPAPQIGWRIPDHLMMLENRPSSDNATVTSTITLVYNTSSSSRHLHASSAARQPLTCVAQNDRYVSVEEIDISMDPIMDPRPKFCWTAYDRSSTPEKFKFAAQAAPSYNVSWWFSACASYQDPDFTGEQLTVYFTNKDPRSSYIQGYLLVPNAIRGAKRGDYEIRIANHFGMANESKHISRRGHTAPPCRAPGRTHQILPQIEIISTSSTPSANTQNPPSPTTSCPLPTTTTPTPTTTTTTTTTQTTTTITIPTITTTTTTTMRATNTTTHPPPPPLSITLTIGACAMVMVIGITLLLVRNLRRSRGRPQLDSDPCPDSPFQITFIGCLCRDEDCHKKSDGLQLQELMPLSADRLVENPEYIGNGKISPSKPQAPVIPRDHVKFVSELGEGAFGRVYLGILDDGWSRPTQVAVKTLKSVGPEARQELEREVELLNNLKHKNIVSFYGVCYNSDPLLMVFEYMEHGDLNNYLRSHNEDVALLAGEETTTEPLSVMDCLQIALQVAAGMKYLASQHYVHRDLATRNCLVGSNLVVKIGDFGMSRDVYTTDYYQFGGRTLLPVRWMPPESILYRRFTIESDIWSFGVVLWEIFTGGKQPWYGYTNQEVITQITAGRMLGCPERCPPDMYSVMLSCWAKNPQERLPMATLYDRIRSLTTVEPHVLDYD